MKANSYLSAVLVLGLLLCSCGQQGESGYQDDGGASSRPSGNGPVWVEPEPNHPGLKDPSKAAEQAPESFLVRITVGAKNDDGEEVEVGAFTVEATRSWAPHCADRFYNLAKIGYLDGCRFFRTVRGFVSQFGMHGDPAIYAEWKTANLVDDPFVQSRGNVAGTLAFASQMRPQTRNVQIFINLVDNRAKLDGYRLFPPFAKITDGNEVAAKIFHAYGERPRQDLIESQGNAYLDANFPKLSYIKSARLAKQ